MKPVRGTTESGTVAVGAAVVVGTIIGGILAIAGGYAGVHYQTSQAIKDRQKNVLRFAFNQFGNISEILKGLEEHRTRAKSIHNDFLDLIGAETQIFGRNIEVLIHVPDDRLMKDIRSALINVVIHVANIKGYLGQYQSSFQISQTYEQGSPLKQKADDLANSYLQEANKACEALLRVELKLTDIRNRIRRSLP